MRIVLNVFDGDQPKVLAAATGGIGGNISVEVDPSVRQCQRRVARWLEVHASMIVSRCVAWRGVALRGVVRCPQCL